MAHIPQSPTTKGTNVVFGGFLTWGVPQASKGLKGIGDNNCHLWTHGVS